MASNTVADLNRNADNLKLVNYYIKVSTEEARKEMNDEEQRDLSIVTGWIRETTDQIHIEWVDPISNVVWKFYHYVPLDVVEMINVTHINGLISQFM